MSVDSQKAIKLFDERAEMHANANAVLDAGQSASAQKSNLMHDFFSKRYVASACKFKSSDTVLDFGCGVGRLTHFYAPQVKEIVGVDASIKMLEIAKSSKGALNTSFFSIIPVDYTKHFDTIFAHWVFAHIAEEDINEYLQILSLSLKDNGRLLIFEQVYHEDKHRLENEVYHRRSVANYQEIFESKGFQLVSNRVVYRTPSYARAVWNKLPLKSKFLFPLLYKLEQLTLNYKSQHIEYTTNCMEFIKQEFTGK